MGKLLRLARPYWYLVILGPVLMAVEVASELVQPRLMALIIDRGIAHKDMAYILRTGGLMLAVAFGGMLFGLGMIVTSSIASQRYGDDLRKTVFGKVLGLSTAEIDRFGAGALVTRLTSDVMQMQQLLMILMRMLVRAPMLCLGSVLLATEMSPSLSRVFWVATPVLFALMWVIQSRGSLLFGKAQGKKDRVNAVLQENLAGARLARALGRSEYEVQRFGHANEALAQAQISSARVMGILDPAVALGMNITIALVVWLGGNMVGAPALSGSQDLTVGQLIAFISYTSQIMFAIVRNGVLVAALARSRASAARIQEIMDARPLVQEPETPLATKVSRGKIEFRDVSFRYPNSGGDPALQNVSFVVEPGETLALIGVTGSGKSTLVSLIPRLHDVSGGSVLVDDVDVRDYSLPGLRLGIGMVLQETILFRGSIEGNLRWGRPDADEAMLEEALASAHADEFVSRLPQGPKSRLGQGGSGLSGGQKQRLGIARALVREPKILILDDATSSVDLGAEARIQAALRDKAGTRTTIVISQRISSVMDADHIIVLDRGRVSGYGTHEELKRDNPVYRDIARSQYGGEVS